jgi:WD40 repeat protein
LSKSPASEKPTKRWPLLLTIALSGVLGFVGCSGKVKDMGQQTGAGAAQGAGAASGFMPGTSLAGAPGGISSPCGASACASYTGPKTFIEPGVAADAPSVFAAGTRHAPGSDPTREPAVIYPANETMFPVNVSHIRHEWSGQGSDLFRLTFSGPKTTVTVYTSSLDWTPTAEEWDWIAESNRGGATQFSVAALSAANPRDIWSSAAITELFSDAAVDGAIYYWSTGSKGVMRALVSDPIPQKFYSDPQASDSDTCVACHTVSRDGKRMAVGYDGENLREVSIPDRSILIPNAAMGGASGANAPAGAGGMPGKMAMPKPPPDPGMVMGMDGKGGTPAAWSTFSPDGKLLLIAKSGVLTLLDSDTGQPVGDDSGVVPLPTGVIATHPDWNAKGDMIALTLGTKGGNKEVLGGSIALLPYNAGKWGAPTLLVQNSGGEDNDFFPVWSPDGKYIAYVNAQGNSNNATSAVLKLVVVADGTIKELVRLNERVNERDGVLGIGNTMPTWAPSTNPGIFWLAFSSLRAYGTVRAQDGKTDQIWIAAVDPKQKEPSYAGFWAPFQSIEEGNHRAFWSHSSEDTQCKCVDLCGDDLDNDCDGVADEKDCSVCGQTEICGDGIDNNCDCLVDNCNVENCGNGSDDDGDGLIDSDDPTCTVK